MISVDPKDLLQQQHSFATGYFPIDGIMDIVCT